MRPVTRLAIAVLVALVTVYAVWGPTPFTVSHVGRVTRPDTTPAVDPKQERVQKLNNADLVADLYLDSFKDGQVFQGSTGNVYSAQDSELANEQLSQNEDRSKPMSQLKIPDEKSFSDITPGDFLKGDATFQSFFKYILELINNNHLSYPLKRRMQLQDGKPIIDNVIMIKDTDIRLSENQLYEFFDFPENFLHDLTNKHKNVVEGLPNVVPNFYSGNGYIMVGGGIYSFYALLGIEALRKVGAKYPVEVLLPDINDYEFEYCEVVLPKLNAKCIEMHRVFGKKALEHFDVKGYQFKAFALLASSFENAFLMDSDTYAIKNLDVLFESELYDKYKMITWPDFWRRTGSPKFYEIQGKEIGSLPVRRYTDQFINPKYIDYDRSEDISDSIPFHDRQGTLPDWSTESGEMLINKIVHFKTLLLALYYNYDGPYGYYPLLSQGGAGEGDKETFVAAANFFDLPWYQVNKSPEMAYGWYNAEDNYEHSSIVQWDPLMDYELLQGLKEKIRQDIETKGDEFHYDWDEYYLNWFTAEKGQPMFYHVHDPKMDPFKIVNERLTLDLNDNPIRNMGEDFPRNNFDLELFIWTKIDKHICKDQTNFNAFEMSDWTSLCVNFIDGYLSFLKESGDRIWSSYDPNDPLDQMRGGRHNS